MKNGVKSIQAVAYNGACTVIMDVPKIIYFLSRGHLFGNQGHLLHIHLGELVSPILVPVLVVTLSIPL